MVPPNGAPDTSIPLNLISYDEVDSTNDELRRLLSVAEKGAQQTITAVVATQQTKGKGRLGRTWASPPGGLYLSFAIELQEATSREASLGLAVALGAREAMQALLSEASVLQTHMQDDIKVQERQIIHAPEEAQEILVKWPNDIVCSRGKLAGILIELVQIQHAQRMALVGIGINVFRPHESKQSCETAAYLSDFLLHPDNLPSLPMIAQRVLTHMVTYCQTWLDAEQTLAPFISEYNQVLSLKGERVKVTNSDTQTTVEGIVQGINEDGHLVLLSQEGAFIPVVGGAVTLRA